MIVIQATMKAKRHYLIVLTFMMTFIVAQYIFILSHIKIRTSLVKGLYVKGSFREAMVGLRQGLQILVLVMSIYCMTLFLI